jgi:hypothetical protein
MRAMIRILLFCSLLSCKRKWTDKDKNDFYSGCMSSAIANKDVTNAKSYCNCLLQKVVAKYPNASDAKYLKYDTTVRELARQCLKQP